MTTYWVVDKSGGIKEGPYYNHKYAIERMTELNRTTERGRFKVVEESDYEERPKLQAGGLLRDVQILLSAR